MSDPVSAERDAPHPRFTEFLNRALEDPEVRAAYEHAQRRDAMPTMRQNPDGWREAEPLGWQEEHGWFARLILAIRGVGHCGKRGWRS